MSPAKPGAAAIVEVTALCRRLRLKYVREQLEEVVLTARAQRWDPTETLRCLLTAEAEGRDRSTIETKRRRARFPAGKTFDTWVPSRSSIPAATQRALRSLEWVDRAENVVLAGPSGTGKSHLLEAIGHQAVMGACRWRGSRSRSWARSCAATASTTPSPRPSPTWPPSR